MPVARSHPVCSQPSDRNSSFTLSRCGVSSTIKASPAILCPAYASLASAAGASTSAATACATSPETSLPIVNVTTCAL